jgi:hypothetical protein
LTFLDREGLKMTMGEQDMAATIAVVSVDDGAVESPRSAVSWAAIAGGAFVAAATSLILLALGSGLGLAAVSPWPGAGTSPITFTVMAGIWLIVVQWAASGVGGYLTGRLRTRWTDLHSHEVFFRDTAHGFLTWAVSTVMVALLAGAAASIGASASSGAKSADSTGPYAYEADRLFRSARPDDSASGLAARAEAGRALVAATAEGAADTQDRHYLADLVAAHTGLTTADAQTRVDGAIDQAREAADKTRKAASATSIFTALAMLIGAFIACISAALGGRQRDEHP